MILHLFDLHEVGNKVNKTKNFERSTLPYKLITFTRGHQQCTYLL